MEPNTTISQPGASMDLSQVLSKSSVDVKQIGAYLDGLDDRRRIDAVRQLSGRAQATLFEAAKGVSRLRLEDLVPEDIAPLVEVPHYGINSLPMFRRFVKVFCRPKLGATELWGYNRSGGFVETVVGPGYYVAYEHEDGQVLIDYTRLPEGKPEMWPELLHNEARFGRFVYAGMQDVLRRVSKHVTIGRAIRHGKVADNWFALCRAS